MAENVRSKMAMTGAAALLMAGAFSTPALAQADPNAAEIAAIVAGTNDCPRGYACLWVDANWSGSRWQGQNNNPTLPSFIDDKASSTFNNGNNCPVHFATAQWYGGHIMTEGLGSIRQNLALNPIPHGNGAHDNFNDRFSSMYWCSY
ncbi:peptidase inhibitor family I36 protein [Streptomyces sp. AP-93]|uniref:peptidase inhibitor family I36 protein n=1 Tax=Streptomyces sp. AP-93 TaxID=2929048 RepID=UPI001FAF3C93|nr:peptidase inhibitor family I36 protein [Streptomyces sp. AP-93]MCJ0875440.1 peptidase inhibitor family I36 protein [Streptomyces sp. AP-93]